MSIREIPKNKNVGESVEDINYNFALLNRSGTGDKSAIFTLSTPSTVWVVLHELWKYPSVTVIDNYGEIILCEIEYTNENTVTLRFSTATAGTVYLN